MGVGYISDWLFVTKQQLMSPFALSFVEFEDNIWQLLLRLKVSPREEMFFVITGYMYVYS